MKALGETVMDLPWLSPCVASLTALARSRLDIAWSAVRNDPALVLLAARLLGPASVSVRSVDDAVLLESACVHLKSAAPCFADWREAGGDHVHRVCVRQAQVAAALATKVGCCDPDAAWTAGMLAPLGWLAIAAHDPSRIAADLETLRSSNDSSDWQQAAWGLDHTAIARRLSRMWRLPAWLTTITGHLGLHVGIAERLGADPRLFRIAQLAVLLCKPHDLDLGLPVGASLPELLRSFDLSADDADKLLQDVLATPLPDAIWEAPAKQPLLVELLHLALENRRGRQAAIIEGLQQDLDRLQEALARQCVEEKQRLHAMKLESLAEFAAGAGHEINNPLAVISGQAQYILKQFELFDGPAAEIEDVAEFLSALREKVTPSLHKIVGQTHRVHSILTDLMQFARPAAPKVQAVPVGRLIRDVNAALKDLAESRQVSLVDADVPADWSVLGDPTQVKHALTGLLRNAIEAAPPQGWAGVRVEGSAKGLIDLVIEDNGAGPTPAMHEHLFDPFYSGRNAGRGRGLGLPTAWRLARQHGGDVRFDGSQRGLTRFVLSLPVAIEAPAVLPLNGNGNGKHERNGHTGAHLEAAS